MISIIRDMIVKKNRHYTGEEGRREGRGGEGIPGESFFLRGHVDARDY